MPRTSCRAIPAHRDDVSTTGAGSEKSGKVGWGMSLHSVRGEGSNVFDGERVTNADEVVDSGLGDHVVVDGAVLDHLLPPLVAFLDASHDCSSLMRSASSSAVKCSRSLWGTEMGEVTRIRGLRQPLIRAAAFADNSPLTTCWAMSGSSRFKRARMPSELSAWVEFMA